MAAEGLLDGVRLTATAWKRAGIPVGDGGGWHTAAELLARSEVSLQQVYTEHLLPCHPFQDRAIVSAGKPYKLTECSKFPFL